MSHLGTTFRVAAPPDFVFDLIADPSRGPEWQTMITEMGEISGRPGGVGSSYVGFYRVAGRRIEGRFVVTAAERPTLHQAAGTTRGGWARWTTMIEATDDGCEVRVDLEYDIPGELLGNLFGLLTGGRLEQEFLRTYDNLRRLAEAEARGEPPGPLPGVGRGAARGEDTLETPDAPEAPDAPGSSGDEGTAALFVVEPFRVRAL
jgi:ribosome-associated toxin RatA of RatAB toxin-antitoxin module